MFDMQAEELKELMGFSDTDSQLKEVYDELDQEQKDKENELINLRNQSVQISNLLDSYRIPQTRAGKPLSIIERIELVLKLKVYA